MEKTAVQLLRQRLLNDQQKLPIYIQYINDVIDYVDNQLLEMEKQQIVDAWDNGYDNGFVGFVSESDSAKQYYKEQFKNK